MTVIMEALSEPNGEMHFMPMSWEIFFKKDLLNIQLLGAESTSSDDDDDDDEESNRNLPHSPSPPSSARTRVP